MAFHITKVRKARDSDASAIQIHLFRSEAGVVCGWYIGPLAMIRGEIHLLYLPRSAQTRAAVAVVRAISAAGERNAALCLVDPDDLWEPAWVAA